MILLNLKSFQLITIFEATKNKQADPNSKEFTGRVSDQPH